MRKHEKPIVKRHLLKYSHLLKLKYSHPLFYFRYFIYLLGSCILISCFITNTQAFTNAHTIINSKDVKAKDVKDAVIKNANDGNALHPFNNIYDENRFYLLVKEIRCVVCQNQTIADSNAPLANDLREKVYHLILENKSDNEIKDYLVKRYGEFILFKPRLHTTTFILWLFPLLAIICAFIFIFYYHKKTRYNNLSY